MASWMSNLKLAFSPKARAELLAKHAQKVLNDYEAGRRYSPRRSYIPGWLRDARFDADAATRMEIVRKARYFERNSAIVNRLYDLFEEYTVGPNGLQFIPASSDRKWNANMRAYWNDWGQFPDMTSLQPFGSLCSLSARTWAGDGEVFILKTRGRVRDGGRSFPRIQLIETHRVETPSVDYANTKIIDGIRVNEDGRPTHYFVQRGDEREERFEEIPAERIVHIFEPTRPGMYRGLPLLYPVLNDLHDLDDLELMAMDISKDAATIRRIVKTKSGELSQDDFRRARLRTDGTQGTSGGSARERSKYYEDVFGPEVKALYHEDEMQQFEVTRPAESERLFWDYKTSKVCAGFGISKLLVFPWSMQGTVTRADLDVAAQFFRSRSGVLGSKWTDVYHYVAEFGIAQERTLSDRPGDWKKVKVRPPRSVNVDVGRNSSAIINEYMAGLRTLESVYGELGEDWVEALEQIGIELKTAADIETRLGLAPGSIINKTLEALQAKLQSDSLENQANQPKGNPASRNMRREMLLAQE